jgi:hypothetical protein
MEGWIKLHRKLLDWRWFNDVNMLKVFLYILLKSNHKKKSWKGVDILPGQMIFSRRKVSERLEISETQIRTVIARLKSTHEITHESTNQFTLITVVNWASYQNEGSESTHESTHVFANEQPTNNQRITTPKERKEGLEGKEKKIRRSSESDPAENDFEKFWEMYDYKKDREKCERLWKKVTAEEKIKIFATIKDYVGSVSEKRFQKYPATYLHNKTWNDEIVKNQSNTFTKGQFPTKSTSIGKILNAD